MRKFNKIILSLLVVGLIPACSLFEKEKEVETYSDLRFRNKPKIELNVKKVNIVSEFTSTFRRPNVEYLFPISIEKTAKNWAEDRLSATNYSSDKVATFVIRDASVTEELEKSDKAFVKDRIKYKAKLNILLKVHDERNLSNAQTEIEAWRELTIPADTSITEKEIYWNGMVEKLFGEFDERFEQNIYQYLNMYVKNNVYVKDHDL